MLKKLFSSIADATRIVLAERKYKLIALVAAIAFALLFFLLPVFTIPGNDVTFWLSIAPWYTYILLAVFSLAMGLLLAMQAFVFINKARLSEAGKGGATLFSTIVAGVYSSAACGTCISTVFSFLGAGGSLFLVNHRTEFISLGLVVAGVSIYLNSRTVLRKCQECAIPLPFEVLPSKKASEEKQTQTPLSQDYLGITGNLRDEKKSDLNRREIA